MSAIARESSGFLPETSCIEKTSKSLFVLATGEPFLAATRRVNFRVVPQQGEDRSRPASTCRANQIIHVVFRRAVRCASVDPQDRDLRPFCARQHWRGRRKYTAGKRPRQETPTVAIPQSLPPRQNRPFGCPSRSDSDARGDRVLRCAARPLT